VVHGRPSPEASWEKRRSPRSGYGFRHRNPSPRASLARTVRRGAVWQLLLFSAIAAVVAGVMALYPHWLPPTASEQADRIGGVFWFTTIICAGIFSIVAAVLVYSLLKFRAPRDDNFETDGAPIHGHTGLEIAWTAVPFALVTAIAVYSAIVLGKNDKVGDNPLRVDVTSQQFAWSFKYPQQQNLSSTVLRLPLGRTIRFHFRALDVLHSFWVPEFSQKQDNVPGTDTYLTVTPNKLGTFPIVCTELCGLGHALMRSTVIVMQPQAWQRWVRSAGQAVSGGGAGAGKTVFTAQGCNSCHTFKPAGATGTVGPDLDKLPEFAQRAGQPLEEFVRQSIVEPDAYVEKGFPPNVMPKTYESLPKQQLDALVDFLAKGAK
jgi:cytochrome c oxidase subunit II